jgi:hypothetical protein
VIRINWNPHFENFTEILQTLFNLQKSSAATRVLPNIREQISLICLLMNLKMFQPDHRFHFILVTLYNGTVIITDMKTKEITHLLLSIEGYDKDAPCHLQFSKFLSEILLEGGRRRCSNWNSIKSQLRCYLQMIKL